MSDLNVFTFTGRLTRDPEEVRYIGKNGDCAVTSLPMAINQMMGEKEITTYIDVDLFGRTAEVMAERLKKGARVSVQGAIRMREWKDKDTGENRKVLFARGDHVNFLDKKKKEEDND